MPANAEVVFVNQTSGQALNQQFIIATSASMPGGITTGFLSGEHSGRYLHLRAQTFGTGAYLAQSVSFTFGGNIPPAPTLTLTASPSLDSAPGTFVTLTPCIKKRTSLRMGRAATRDRAQASTVSRRKSYALSGSATVVPTQTSTYTISCGSAAGQNVTQSVTVTVGSGSQAVRADRHYCPQPSIFQTCSVVAAAAMAPFSLMVDSLTDIFVQFGIGQ